ncbi:MAG: FxsA family protein [Mycobacterium sp.]|nr:FxsA family protein [Mycobacterium sp.]
MRPFARYAMLYALVELTAFALLVWAFGVGWALLVMAVVFMLGVVLAASGLKSQVGAMRRARRDPHAAVADGALVGVGSVLVFLPGVVSSAVGALMLAPPTRSAMRPIAAALVTRGVMRGMRAVNFDRSNLDNLTGGRPLRRDYIDGEVLGEVAVDRLPVRR